MSFGSPFLTLPEFKYERPETLDVVLRLLGENGENAKVMAGGVGLLAFMKERLMAPAMVVDIKNVKELRRMEYTRSRGLSVGAAVTLEELSKNETVRSKYSCLHEAVSRAADPIIRGRATLVGNLCEAIPWVDSPPALIALGASVEISKRAGSREVRVEDFIRGPVDVDLNPGEMVVAVNIPDPASYSRSAFEKFSAGAEFSIASVAVHVEGRGADRISRIVYGAVSSKPARCLEAEKVLAQNEPSPSTFRIVAKAASENLELVSDVLASAEYRRHLVEVITMKALRRVFGK